jgi:hypothetical protein
VLSVHPPLPVYAYASALIGLTYVYYTEFEQKPGQGWLPSSGDGGLPFGGEA